MTCSQCDCPQFRRGLCRSCYRKHRDCALAMPSKRRVDLHAHQNVRRLREWIARLAPERRDAVRRIAANVVEAARASVDGKLAEILDGVSERLRVA